MKTYKPKYSFDLAWYFNYVAVYKEGSHKGECGSYFNKLTKREKELALTRNLEIRRVIK